jgi:hypothetical protein
MVRTSQAAEACMPVPTLPEPAGAERPSVRRRDERHSVRLTALAHCHGRFQTVRIVDFSAGGLQLQGGFGVGPGDEVVVELLSGAWPSAPASECAAGSRLAVTSHLDVSTTYAPRQVACPILPIDLISLTINRDDFETYRIGRRAKFQILPGRER